MTTPVVIEDQAGLDALFQGVVNDFESINWRPWLTKTMRAVETEHAQMWGQQRDPAGEPWKKLAPSTVRRKGHSTILVETGRLRRSLTTPNDGVREMFQEGGNIGLIFGTDVPYSIYHLRGGERLPKRDHVGLPLPMFEGFVGDACDFALKELAQ
jgi:phage gpG-like protein